MSADALMRLPGKYFLQNLIERHHLLTQLVKRDFEQRFVGSVAGWLWGIIHPLVLLLSWTFVFQVCLGVGLSPDAVTQNYTLFLFAGFLPWLLLQETLQRTSTCLIENAHLITKVLFPSELIPLAMCLSSVISHFMALILLLVAIWLWGESLGPSALLLPVYLFLLCLFATGLGWFVSSLQVYLRDTAQLVSVGLTLWFWTTPIFITEQQYPEAVRFLLRVNPMAFLVRAYRQLLLANQLPSLSDTMAIAGYAVLSFGAGGLFFRYLKKGFADVL